MSYSAEEVVFNLALTIAIYRFLISPVSAWGAVSLGAGQYPKVALHGTYPESRVSRRAALQVGLVVTSLTVLALVLGVPALGDMEWVPRAAIIILLWKYLTLDYDAAQKLGWQRADRVATLLLGVAAIASPAFSFAAVVMVCGRLGGWSHHSKTCVRLIKASFAGILADSIWDAASHASAQQTHVVTMLIMLSTVYLSHYVVACHSKIRLGPKPWSWASENRTDVLVACSYAWGWGRFIPEKVVVALIRRLESTARWLNYGTLVIEALGLAAFANRWVLPAALLGAMLFNTVVALTSGLLFWENIAIGAVISVAALRLPPTISAVAFGPEPWILSLVVLALVLGKLLWRPSELGWWDTPLAARVYWTARTRDGRHFGVYNDFMSPFDREFGRHVGNPLAERPIVASPMGAVLERTLRDRVFRLEFEDHDPQEFREECGDEYRRGDFRIAHTEYLRRLFGHLNDGGVKSPLPRRMKWLKAPGGHLYYWGDLPRYTLREGPVEAIQIRYKETYYSSSSHSWSLLHDELLFEITLDEKPARILI